MENGAPSVSVVTNMSHRPAVGQVHTAHLLEGMAEKLSAAVVSF